MLSARLQAPLGQPGGARVGGMGAALPCFPLHHWLSHRRQPLPIPPPSCTGACCDALYPAPPTMLVLHPIPTHRWDQHLFAFICIENLLNCRQGGLWHSAWQGVTLNKDWKDGPQGWQGSTPAHRVRCLRSRLNHESFLNCSCNHGPLEGRSGCVEGGCAAALTRYPQINPLRLHDCRCCCSLRASGMGAGPQLLLHEHHWEQQGAHACVHP